MNSLNLVLIGPPGSGKGTQAELLREKNGFVHYSTGEVFRDLIRRKTPVGARVEGFVTSGKLVPDDVVLDVVNAFLAENIGKPRAWTTYSASRAARSTSPCWSILPTTRW